MEKRVFVPKEVIEELKLKPATEISDETSIIFDRNQPIIRIPVKISTQIKAKKGDRMKITISKKDRSTFVCKMVRK